MRIRNSALVFICLFFAFCAQFSKEKIWILGSEMHSAYYVIAEKSQTYDNYTVDEVWKGLSQTLADHAFYHFEVNKALGRIVATRPIIKRSVEFGDPLVKEEDFEQMRIERPRGQDLLYFFLLISEADGKVILSCKVATRGRKVGVKGEEELNRFLKAVDKRLNK